MARINDYTERTTLTGAEELVGVDGVDTFKFTPETLREYDISKVLTGNITKTLAPSGGDFDTLSEINLWLNSNTFSNAKITINVSDATYSVTNETIEYIGNGNDIIELNFYGNNRATTVFEFTQTSSIPAFKIKNVAYVNLSNITIRSLTSTANFDFGIQFYDNTYMQLEQINVEGFYTAIYSSNAQSDIIGCNILGRPSSSSILIQGVLASQVSVNGSTLNNINNNGVGIRAQNPNTVVQLVDSVVIENCSTAIFIVGSAKVYPEYTTTTITLTNNTAISNIPLNQIQFNGGYVATTIGGLTLPPIFNNQTGTTYTIQSTDNGKVLTFNNANPIAVTLPDGVSTGFSCTIIQLGTGVPTITPATNTINGVVAGVTPSAQWKELKLSKYSSTAWVAVIN